MKQNKALIYLVILIVAFIAALVFVELAQKSSGEDSYAYKVLPEKAYAVIILSKPADFINNINSQLESSSVEDFNQYPELASFLPVAQGEIFESVDDFKRKLGICLYSTTGVIQMEASTTSTVAFFNLLDKEIFKNYIHENFTIKQQDFNGDVIYSLTPVKKGGASYAIMIKESTIFIAKNYYYLKKLLSDDFPKLKDNEQFKKTFDTYSSYPLIAYFNTQRIGEQLASIFAFFGPTLKESVKASSKDQPGKQDELADSMEMFFREIVKLLKGQESIYCAVKIEGQNIIIDSNIFFKMSDETRKVFQEKPIPNKYMNYLSDKPVVVAEDNTTPAQSRWFNSAFSGPFNVKERDSSTSDERLSAALFTVFPGEKNQKEPYQLVFSYEDGNNEKDFSTNYVDVNVKFQKIKNFLPVKLEFVKNLERQYKGYKITEFTLKIQSNDEFFAYKISLGNDGSDKQVIKEFNKTYNFMIANKDKLSIFIGSNELKMNVDDIINMLGKGDYPKLIDNPKFKEIKSKTLEDANFTLYFDITGYIAPIFKEIEQESERSDGRIARMLSDFQHYWNMVSYRLYKEGINSRLILNLNDIGQLLKISKEFDYLSEE